MTNITFVIHTLGGGGAERVLVDLVNNLDKDMFNVSVVTIIDTGLYRDALDASINYSHVLKLPGFVKSRFTSDSGTLIKDESKVSGAKKLYCMMWRYFGTIISRLSSRRYRNEDIVVSFLEGATQLYVSKIKTKAKKVAWIHVDLSVEKKSETFFRDLDHNLNTYKCFDDVVAVSDEVKASVHNYIGYTGNVEVITNVYNESLILGKALNSIEPLGSDSLNFVSVGRLSNQKGYDRLIAASKRLTDEGYTFKVRIIGDGEDRESLQNSIIQHKLENVVLLLGFISNPYPYIKHSDVFICSSRTEGYSTVVVESIIIGTPAIVTDCSGMAGILETGALGNIVENSEDGIYNGMLNVLSNPHELEVLQDKAKLGQGKYQLNVLVKKVEDYLHSIV